MENYTLARVNGAPDWSAISALAIDQLQWSAPTPIRARGQLCYDETAIYVRLSAVEREIRAEHRGTGAMVCEDSCLEFFLRPYEEDLRYFNFEFNPNCALYLGFGSGMHDLTHLLVADEEALFAPRAERTADGWSISYRVPFAFIRRFFPAFAPRRGEAFRGNCYKCGDLTVQEHYLSWNRLNCDAPAFHRPQDFGRLVWG